MLLELCAEQELMITNSLFQQKANVHMRQKDLCDVLYTRVMPRTDCNTDHRLVRTKVRLNIKAAVKKRGAQVKKLAGEEN